MNKKKRFVLAGNLSAAVLQICGLILLAAGCLSTVLQKILGVGQGTNLQLLETIQTDPNGMTLATVALICQILEMCAVPLFAFLFVEGAAHTKNFGLYLLRVIVLALVCEIPHNLLLYGTVFGPGELSPAFAAVFSLTMLFFFRTFPEKSAGHVAIRIVAVLGTFLWSNFLGVAFGGPCVLITAVFWLTRERRGLQLFFGTVICIACSVFSPLYLSSALAIIVIFFYGGERGKELRLLRYLGYPVLLFLFWMFSMFI